MSSVRCRTHATRSLNAPQASSLPSSSFVRVSELGNRARFTLEPLAELRVSSEGFGKNLDRDDAIETRVAGLVAFERWLDAALAVAIKEFGDRL